jgi:adenylate cyclase
MTAGLPTQPTLSREVFISYASQDKPVADAVVGALELAGLKCWIAPRDVTPGGHYADAIMGAISGAKTLVLVLSDSALASKHVGKEIERASSKGRAIIALRTTATPLTPAFEYFLSESQWIDVGPGGIAGISSKLVEAVRSHLTSGTSSTPSKPLTLDRKVAPSRWRWIAIASAAVLATALVYFLAPKFWLTKQPSAEQPATTAAPPTATISDKSIAVLPFADMSEKHDQEYMSDGIAEELLNLLAQAAGLKVIARTSSFAFKGKAVDIGEIAKKLNVAHVLEGSVRKSGDKIRITAQLIRTADSKHLWSETYDRPLKDVFAVQDEIAGAIVQALQIQLAGGELNRKKGGTQNLEAYQLYLRSRGLNRQNTRSSLDAAGTYLEQATKIDPGYGLAWAALSDIFSTKADNGFLDATKGYEMAREAANRALQLSPENAFVYAKLEYFKLNYDWDWAEAEAAGRRARAISSTDPEVSNVAGILSYTLGHWSDAERQIQESLIRDPLNPYVIWNLGYTYYATGRFADSEAVYLKLLETEPTFSWTRNSLGKTVLAQGRADEALGVVRQIADEGEALKYLPVFLQAVGRQSEADAALRAQISRWSDAGAYYIAMTYAYRGDHDHAFEWLERAYKQKDAFLSTIKGEHLFKGLADDPRFKAFLRKMNLPE